MKGGPNVVAPHGSTVTLPAFDEVIFEGEMGIVIGEQCRNVDPADAYDVIGGYTCVNDITVISSRDVSPFYERKSFDNALPIGPVVVPPDAIGDEPHIQVWVNDKKQQDSSGETFVYSIPEVISELSSNVTLEPDDVVLMGTPSGAVPLEDGDTVRVQIDGIGELAHSVQTP
jgi:2-keto-4-pentenoate hydratase/2-oxohepta-3-ene-1,7-dioic acid hydratase in catechol pathway